MPLAGRGCVSLEPTGHVYARARTIFRESGEKKAMTCHAARRVEVVVFRRPVAVAVATARGDDRASAIVDDFGSDDNDVRPPPEAHGDGTTRDRK
jgi:hypothetical protein